MTVDGSVYSCGKNDSAGGGGHGSPPIPNSGQLGRSGTSTCGKVIIGFIELSSSSSYELIFIFLAQVEFNLDAQQIVSVAAGRYHSVALNIYGQVITWGLNDWGQLGREGIKASRAYEGLSSTYY